MVDKMKLLLNKIKSENKKKNKNLDKIKQSQILFIKIKYASNPDKFQSALKELNKIHVVNKNLHEIKQEILVENTGEFEMVGNLSVGHQVRETRIKFKNRDDFESYFNAIDEGYEAKDAIFNDYIYKIKTIQVNLVNRSQYGNDCDFKHKINEYHGNNCYIPTNG